MPTGVVDIYMLVDKLKGGRVKCPYSVTTQPTKLPMNFQTEIALALRDFMNHMQPDLNDAVDWVCEVFDVNATDELIDSIADEFDSL